MNQDTIIQIDDKIQSINEILEQIKFGINFKANTSNLSEITKENNMFINKFIEKINNINNIFKNNKRASKDIEGNLNDNQILILKYNLLIEFLKLKSNSNKSEQKVNNKIVYLNKFNYTNLSSPIINLYITNILSKLLCINICLKFFIKLTAYYQSLISDLKIIDSKTIFDIFLNSLFSNKDYYLITQNNTNNTIINCIYFQIIIYEEEINLDINKAEKIKIKTITKINFKFDNSLSFNINFKYDLYENKLINNQKSNDVYNKCNNGEKKYDSDIIGKDTPSRFRIRLYITNDNNDIFNDFIFFNINYYKCISETIFNKVSDFRYEFVLTIKDQEYYLNPYDSTNIFDNLVI
jgi:hypothetical protein